MENTKKLVKIIARLNAKGFSFQEYEVSYKKTKTNFVVKREFDGDTITQHWPLENIEKVQFLFYEYNRIELYAFCYPENVEVLKDKLMAEIQKGVDFILKQALSMSQIFVQAKRNKV